MTSSKKGNELNGKLWSRINKIDSARHLDLARQARGLGEKANDIIGDVNYMIDELNMKDYTRYQDRLGWTAKFWEPANRAATGNKILNDPKIGSSDMNRQKLAELIKLLNEIEVIVRSLTGKPHYDSEALKKFDKLKEGLGKKIRKVHPFRLRSESTLRLHGLVERANNIVREKGYLFSRDDWKQTGRFWESANRDATID